jgi:phospholipid transport system transporter-binding protein
MFKPAVKLTMEHASETLAAGLQAITAGESDFDLSEALSVDSSAVAVMLAWQRQAQQQGRTLRFGALPPNLQSLIALYGVADLLPSELRTTADNSNSTDSISTAGGVADIRHH